MLDFLARITENCFAASYALALALELWHQVRPRPVQRLLAHVAAGAGLVAHTAFLALNPGVAMSPFGSLVVLAWILAIFYLYGSLHHPRVGWGLFVLPVVTGLALLAKFAPREDTRRAGPGWEAFDAEKLWPAVHGWLLVLAAVGVCVGFVASVMYLVQVWRLRAKLPPGRGLKVLSLERLEAMNRRAILLAFPLLTAGLLLGGVLLMQNQESAAWESVKILSTVALWLVFAILLYQRYAAHAGGRQLALLTIVAFALTLFSLVSAHAFVTPQGVR
jgi:ABC-type transport system involved in cytochrome c biogenesis permease subunit